MEAFHKRLLKLQTELAVLIQDVESSFEGVPLAPARRRGRPPKVKVAVAPPSPSPVNDTMIEELENFLNEIEKTVLPPPPIETTRPKRGRPKKVVAPSVPHDEHSVEAPVEASKPKRSLKLKSKSK